MNTNVDVDGFGQPASPPGAVRRRPVVMGCGGLFAGLGLALLLIHFGRIALGTNAPYAVIAAGVAFGVALSYTLPPRAPRRQRATSTAGGTP